jgi:hypothetical protein
MFIKKWQLSTMMHILCLLLLALFPINIFYIQHYVPFSLYYIWHISNQLFFTIRHHVPFGVYYIQQYFQSSFLLFDILCHSAFITYVIISFVVIYHSTFCPFNDFYHLTFSHWPFVPVVVLSLDVFYRLRFLLRHFVGESKYIFLLKNCYTIKCKLYFF